MPLVFLPESGENFGVDLVDGVAGAFKVEKSQRKAGTVGAGSQADQPTEARRVFAAATMFFSAGITSLH